MEVELGADLAQPRGLNTVRADAPLKEVGPALVLGILYSEGKHQVRLSNLEASLSSYSQGIIRGRLEAKMAGRACEGT